MYIPLGIKTDYSLLKSMIKIPDLITYLKKHNITTCGILDDNLYSSMCFYDTCLQNDIKPIIGLKINIGDKSIYLYAINYQGYQNLLKINTLKETEEISIISLKKYCENIICVLPYDSYSMYKELNKLFECTYLAYNNDYEKSNASILTTNIVFLCEVCTYKFNEIKYLSILREIDTGEKIDFNEFSDNYLERELNDIIIKLAKRKLEG